MASTIQTAIARLKHKDVRQRRRAVRVLFDSNAHESVEAFSQFLNSKDVWFRNKAIEAYRRWAPEHAPHLLEHLALQNEIDGQRCVAAVLDKVKDSKFAANLARLLLDCGDVVVVRRAVNQLISTQEATETELRRFQTSKDHAIRAYAAINNEDAEELILALQDPHPDVRWQAATSLMLMDLNSEQNQQLQNAIEHDDALWKLAIPIALEHNRPNLSELMTSKNNSKRRFLVQTLRDVVSDADDPRLRTLIDGNGTSLVARWLVGRNDPKSDELRNELLFDERVDSIDKSRLLERLLHRQGEPAIQDLASKLLDSSNDDLVLSAAQNLYTA